VKQKIRIAAVSYLNTIPFIYGIENSPYLDSSDYELKRYIPSECANKLINNQADIGLIPVAVIPKIENPEIISDFCIGAEGPVKTVLLLSKVPLNEIKTILLDYQSRTSINLVQVLAKDFWGVSPKFVKASNGYENKISGDVAGVIIGDRTFHLQEKFPYKYDLSEEWKKFTQLPFVFATWTANKKIDSQLISKFNKACSFGVDNIEKALEDYYQRGYAETNFNYVDYLKKYISYTFDSPKKQALNLFLKALEKVNPKKNASIRIVKKE